MARTGRPKKEINKGQFEKLCAIFCTEEDIADFFDCSIDTIKRFCKATYNLSFAQTYKKYSAQGRCSLRRYQFNIAEKNAAMAIFLGKNYLGQTDRDPLELKYLEARIAALEAGQGGAIDDKTREQVDNLLNDVEPELDDDADDTDEEADS